MQWQQPVEFAAISDVGMRRQNNQDSCVVLLSHDEADWRRRGHLFVVADGMGGHAVGDLASKIAVDTLPQTYHKQKTGSIPEALQAAIVEANAAIYQRGQQNADFRDMGTTCTSLVLGPDGALAGHVGDSRLYRVRKQRIDQLTFDHSLQWELARQGKYSPEEVKQMGPRNVITRCLGPDGTVEVDLEGPHPVRSNDVYLLCSDGLTNHVEDHEIGAIAGELPPGDACRLLVNLANLRGGTDNVTVVIARVGKPTGPRSAAVSPSLDDEEPRTGWGWLLAAWGVALLAAVGILLLMTRQVVEGAVVLGIALAGLGGWFYARFKLVRPVESPAEMATTLSRPHRTASAKLTSKFINQLAALETILQKAAAEEDWSIDWTEFNARHARADAARAAGQHGPALRELAQSIHALMSAVQHQRKRMDEVIRQGRKWLADRSKP